MDKKPINDDDVQDEAVRIYTEKPDITADKGVREEDVRVPDDSTLQEAEENVNAEEEAAKKATQENNDTSGEAS